MAPIDDEDDVEAADKGFADDVVALPRPNRAPFEERQLKEGAPPLAAWHVGGGAMFPKLPAAVGWRGVMGATPLNTSVSVAAIRELWVTPQRVSLDQQPGASDLSDAEQDIVECFESSRWGVISVGFAIG